MFYLLIIIKILTKNRQFENTTVLKVTPECDASKFEKIVLIFARHQTYIKSFIDIHLQVQFKWTVLVATSGWNRSMQTFTVTIRQACLWKYNNDNALHRTASLQPSFSSLVATVTSIIGRAQKLLTSSWPRLMWIWQNTSPGLRRWIALLWLCSFSRKTAHFHFEFIFLNLTLLTERRF